MTGFAKERVDRGDFHHTARVHHSDAIRELGQHREIVGDVHHRHAQAAAKRREEVDDLFLGSDIEPGGRLVQHHQGGVAAKRHRNAHALLLAAGKLMRIPFQHAIGFGQAHLLEQIPHSPPRRFPRDRGVVVGQDFDHEVADPAGGIEGGGRIMGNEADAPAAQCGEGIRGKGEQIPAIAPDLPARDLRPRMPVSKQREGKRALAAAGFADEPEDFPFGHFERDNATKKPHQGQEFSTR